MKKSSRISVRRSTVAGLTTVVVSLVITACGSSSSGGSTTSSASTSSTSAAASSSSGGAPSGGTATALRLGYFANVTHAAAVLGVADGTFQSALGSTKLTTQVFNAGPAAIEALNAGSIDAAYLGPSPAINSYVKSSGASLRIVAGATANGASLVVKSSISSAADLKGKKIATPQLGSTQDVALREYLFKAGLKVKTNGGSDVDVISQDNSQTLDLFKSGQVDGGWLPEPWASRLVLEAGAKTLVNESTLWPNGQFPTTILIVGKTYLDAHPDTVKALITGELTEIDAITKDPTKAESAVNAAIGTLTGKKLSDAVAAASFKNIKVTDDPLASTYQASGQHAVDGGLLKTAPDVNGIFDLRILNSILKTQGKPAVSADSLGQE